MNGVKSSARNCYCNFFYFVLNLHQFVGICFLVDLRKKPVPLMPPNPTLTQTEC